MKVKRFDGRWDNEELDAFLEMDSVSIHIRHITESDYQIRVYYDEVTSFSAMSNEFLLPHQQPSDDFYSNQPYYQYRQPGYTNQPSQDPISISDNGSGSRSNGSYSSSFVERLRRSFGGDSIE